MAKVLRDIFYIGLMAVLIGTAAFGFTDMYSSYSFAAAEEPQGHMELIDGAYFYYDENDQQVKDQWVTFSGKNYLAGPDGKLIVSSFVDDEDGNTLYLGKNGAAVIGVYQVGDKVYSADENGRLITEAGWTEQNGKRYYNIGNGTCYTSRMIRTDLDSSYYFGEDGAVKTGVFQVGNTVYDADEKGELKRIPGWESQGGHKYFNRGDGICYSSIKVSTAPGEINYFGEDGALLTDVFKFDGKVYSSDSSGVLNRVKGWETRGDKKYYNIGNGECYADCAVTIDGGLRYFDADGVVQKGTIFEKDGERFYADDSGNIVTHTWIDFAGKRYFASDDGSFSHDEFILVDDSYYYTGSDGSVVKTPFDQYNGYTLHPDPKTGAISKREYNISLSDYIYNGCATYVKVNIWNQSLMLVYDGEYIMSCSIVSGTYDKFDTPRGWFSVQNMGMGVRLKGQQGDDQWDVVVNYWIGFLGSAYGIHDASWRGSFGGSIYMDNGSHGCVNVPTWAAATIYDYVDIGTPVFVV